MKFWSGFTAGMVVGSGMTLFAVIVSVLQEFWSGKHSLGTHP